MNETNENYNENSYRENSLINQSSLISKIKELENSIKNLVGKRQTENLEFDNNKP